MKRCGQRAGLAFGLGQLERAMHRPSGRFFACERDPWGLYLVESSGGISSWVSLLRGSLASRLAVALAMALGFTGLDLSRPVKHGLHRLLTAYSRLTGS